MSRRCRWPILAGLLGLLPNLGCLNHLPRTSSMDLPSLSSTGTAGERPAPELPTRKSAQACLRMAATMEQNGHDAEAVMEYERGRQYDPHARDVARRLATLYDRLGIPQRALEEFQKALQESPKDADLVNDLGYSYYNRGQFAEAEKHFRQALALNAKHSRAWNNLGLTLGQQGRFPEALLAFGHVVSAAEAHSNLGFVLSTQGKREEASKEYAQALAMEPGLRIAQLALAKLEKPEAAPAEPAPLAKVGTDRPAFQAAEKQGAKSSSSLAKPNPLPDLDPVVVDLPKPGTALTLPLPGKGSSPERIEPPKPPLVPTGAPSVSGPKLVPGPLPVASSPKPNTNPALPGVPGTAIWVE